MSGQPCVITVSKNLMSAEIQVSTDADVSETELWQALKHAGICHGLKNDVIPYALQNRDTAVVAAEGTSPLPGEDDFLRWHIDEQLLADEIQGKVAADLRQKIEIPAVEPGQPLAERISGKPGTPGKNVYGDEIPAPTPAEIVLRTLKGTRLSGDGLTVIAEISGRPRFERRGRVCRFQVLPVYTHSGDVTVDTGHLSFQGDIIVLGNLTEGTSVTASGNVEVMGSCIGAAVTAGQCIRISGNVIQSRLLSGSERQFASEVLPFLDEMIFTLYELSSVVDSLNNRGQLGQLPFAEIGRRILNLRYPQYTETVAKLGERLRRQHEKTPTNASVLQALKEFPHFRPESWSDRSQADDAASRAGQLKAAFAGLLETGADIYLAYALNADIQAAGNIIVQGQGSLHSTLTAGGAVKIQGKLRSGTVNANLAIYAREVGSDAGALATLTVNSGGKIEFDKAYENTTIQVGKTMVKITETTGRSRTALDSSGRLQLMARH